VSETLSGLVMLVIVELVAVELVVVKLEVFVLMRV